MHWSQTSTRLNAKMHLEHSRRKFNEFSRLKRGDGSWEGLCATNVNPFESVLWNRLELMSLSSTPTHYVDTHFPGAGNFPGKWTQRRTGPCNSGGKTAVYKTVSLSVRPPISVGFNLYNEHSIFMTLLRLRKYRQVKRERSRKFRSMPIFPTLFALTKLEKKSLLPLFLPIHTQWCTNTSNKSSTELNLELAMTNK